MGILADDLTGACDVAGRLVALGFQPIVALRPIPARALRQVDGDILVANTRARASSSKRAGALAGSEAVKLERLGWRILYLKLDSTLRGNWPTELVVLEQNLHRDCVMLCPAFPAQGRVFRNANLQLPRAIMKEFRRSQPDGWSPNLRRPLRRELGFSPQLVRLETVRRGATAVRQAVQESKARFLVLDATEERDLATIGRAFAHTRMRVLWAGSAGLARYVFPERTRTEHTAPRAPRLPWLFIEGSRQAISHQQFDRLDHQGSLHSISFHSSPGGSHARRQMIDEILSALKHGKSVSICVAQEYRSNLPRQFADFLKRLLHRCCRNRLLGGIFISGGGTGEAVCDSLRARTLRIVSEVRPGIPRGILRDGRWPGLELITKAGGFGQPDEVVRIFREVTR